MAVYPFLNRDLLVAGVIIHDLAKTDELVAKNTGIATAYTRDGALLGHIIQGVTMVDRIGRELGTNEELLSMLEHMVLTHHYEPEYGSPKRPMFRGGNSSLPGHH
jgi:3'-5' exoribonuclease